MTSKRQADRGLVLKTVKVSGAHDRWLKAHPELNFSRWVREQLDQEMQREQQKRRAGGVSALILAAGEDPGLRPLNEELPKALLDVRGKSILERQIEVLEQAGVSRIGVLRGYQSAKFTFPGLYYYDNPAYGSRGILHSLACGLEFLVGATLVVYADTLFRRSVLDRLLDTSGPLVLGVDRSLPSRRHGSKRVVEAVSFASRKASEAAGPITRVSRDLPRAQQHAEFIGLALVRQEAVAPFTELVRALDERPANARAHLPTLFDAWLKAGRPLGGAGVGPEEWMDVDTFEDYRDAWSRVT